MSRLPVSKQAIGLLGFLALAMFVGAIGAVASVNASSFYNSLQQPSWAPPAGVFGPVWSTLYLLMALSGWMVWRGGGFGYARQALLLFVIQLAVNALWSWLFFAWHLGGPAFVDIIVLWVLIVLTIIAFWRIQRLAAMLLVPYLLWVSFAGVLNYAVWKMNPGVLGG